MSWRCIYHIDLGQNAVFPNFSRQIATVNIQDDQSWAFSDTVQKISKITYISCGSILSSFVFGYSNI